MMKGGALVLYPPGGGATKRKGPPTVYKAVPGDAVVARYSKSSLWYAAVVVEVRDDGMIKIKWGDGDKVI